MKSSVERLIKVDKIDYRIDDDRYVIEVCSYQNESSKKLITNYYKCDFLYYSDTKRGYLSSPLNNQYIEMDDLAKKKFKIYLENKFNIVISNIK